MSAATLQVDAGLAVFWLSFCLPIVTLPFWHWWQSQWGWNIVAFEWSIAWVLVPTMLHFTFDINVRNPAWAWASGFGLVLVGIILVWRTILIVVTQRAETVAELRRKQDQAADKPVPTSNGS